MPEPADEEPVVTKRVEEGLLFHLKRAAHARCRDTSQAYADCCRGRTFSMVWSCRRELGAYSDCLHKHTSPAKMGELKRRWLDAGRPVKPDWDALLEGL